MKIIALDQVSSMPMQMAGAVNVTKQVPIGKDDGAPLYSFRVFTVKPGGETPYHVHDFEHMNYIIAGEGVLVNEAGEIQPVKAGDFAMVLPNEKHQYRNTSAAGDLQFICGVPLSYE
ncbi:MAG: cupin [Desulfuromonas sp.]|nr:MAG: cupin [Desulfuromonas sp.]